MKTRGVEASVRPKRFEDYIGQSRAKENLLYCGASGALARRSS